jgi:hypothetical protein
MDFYWLFASAADYEFKHLLKRIQLSRTSAPQFVVITGGSDDDCQRTYANYQGFFGRGVKKDENFFEDGLSNDAITAAHA